jgi:antitoxin (DNA-binding transcriptional repressor) of toxin-antitoxin stability system
MNFYPMRDLRTESKTMWADLDRGDEVVLTNNGKPAAIIIDIPEGHFDETVQAVCQAKAMIALNSIRQKAAKGGYMSDDNIDDIIREVRASSPTTDKAVIKRGD